jgi:hypothetical protein
VILDSTPSLENEGGVLKGYEYAFAAAIAF